MKRQIIRFTLTLIAFFIINDSFAQLKDVADMLRGGVDDAEILFKGYLSPLTNAFGTNLNAGWYNTAKPHKLGGFDITITFNATLIPDVDKTFELSGLTATVDGDNMTPTASGKRDPGPYLVYSEEFSGTNYEIARYRTPQGIGVGFVPLPLGQIGIGFIKGTELVGRFLPKLSFFSNSLELGLWGIGVKHDIKQWIPLLEKVPVINLSVFGGYTKFGTTTKLSLEPEDLGFAVGTYVDNTGGNAFDDQKMVIGVRSFTANLLVSANLPVVCFYGGAGFATTKANLDLKGSYPMPGLITELTDPNLGRLEITSLTDPFGIEIKNKAGGVTKPRLNVGMRIKLGVITFHGDYTYSSYSVITGGIGISFR